MADADFAAITLPVARSFWGDPNEKLSTAKETRWGSGGSRVVYHGKGMWHDFERDIGGGVIALVQHELGLGEGDKAGALQWLEDEGYLEPRERQSAPQSSAERREAPPATEGLAVQERAQARPSGDETAFDVAKYNYTDAAGVFQYQVIRQHFRDERGEIVIDPKTGNPKKTFKQKSRDETGHITWGLNGRSPCLYRWQEIELAAERGEMIFIAEGEKDVHSLLALGFEATTNSGGSKNWRPEFIPSFKLADVVVLVDNDEAGRERGDILAKSLNGTASRIRVLDLSQHVPNFPEKHDVTDWIEAGGTADELRRIIDGLPDWRPAPPVSKFAAARGMDLAGSKIVYDWLIKGLVERSGVFIVAGEKQSGKSFVVIDMGMKIALGLPYGKGDQARKVRQGAVVYMAAEDRKGVELRYEGWRRDNGVPAEQDVPFIIMGGGDGQKFSLMSDESVDAFIAECQDWKAFYGNLELIVIDTFSMATEGLDEIHSGEVGKVLGRVNRIADKTGSTVCLVHHMNGEGSRVRGHSSLTANVSQVIEISTLRRPSPNRRVQGEEIRDADKRIIRKALLEKNKNGPNRISWRFILRQVKLGHDDDGFEITTCVLDTPSSEPDEEQAKTARLSPDQKLVLDCLVDATHDVGIDMPSGVRVGPQIKKAVPFGIWRDYVRKRWTFKAPDTEPEQQAKELVEVMARTGKALMNAGYMGRDNDKKIVWSLGKERERVFTSAPEPSPPPPLPDDVRNDLNQMSGVPDEVPF